MGWLKNIGRVAIGMATGGLSEVANVASGNKIYGETPDKSTPAWAGLNADGTMNPTAAAENPQDAYAALTRAQYDEWVNTFQPAEGDLLSMTTYNGNPGLAAGMIADQQKNIDANFTGAAEQQQRNFSRYGMTQTAEQASAAADDMALEKSKATIDAINKTNRWQEDLNKQIMSAGVSSTAGMNRPKEG